MKLCRGVGQDLLRLAHPHPPAPQCSSTGHLLSPWDAGGQHPGLVSVGPPEGPRSPTWPAHPCLPSWASLLSAILWGSRWLLCPRLVGGNWVGLLPRTGEVGPVRFPEHLIPGPSWLLPFPSAPGTACHVRNKEKVCGCRGDLGRSAVWLLVRRGSGRRPCPALVATAVCPVPSRGQAWGEGRSRLCVTEALGRHHGVCRKEA